MDTAAVSVRLRASTARCPACLGGGARHGYEVDGHSFRRCPHCRSLFLVQPPEPTISAELYTDERYYANARHDFGEYCGYRDYFADRKGLEEKFDRVLAHVERYAPPGRLLDVGAGPGILVAVAARRGWDSRGLDLNPWAADHARRALGVDVRAGTLRDAEFHDESFDAVTMMDFIEHVPDPEDEIAEVARVTREGGLVALLTPDAGSPTTRLVGRRWPEVQRAGEHIVLFSVEGLSELLLRCGFEPLGWHWIGKTAPVAALVADLAPAAPRLAPALSRALAARALGKRRFEFDPRAKFCLYARRRGRHADGAATPSLRRPARLPRRPVKTETAILEELSELARARRLCDWMFDQYAAAVHGRVAEVGAGIGTFSERILEAGAEALLLVEPSSSCAAVLERRFGSDPRVTIVRETLPEARALREGSFDLVVCQNVLEHISDDAAAVTAMGQALAPGGRLALLVPAQPGLFGSLDERYGHFRRYDAERLRGIVCEAGLDVLDIHPFNMLGIPGWWVKNQRPSSRVGPLSLAAYEALVRLWRPLEERVRPRWGLSLIVHARPAP